MMASFTGHRDQPQSDSDVKSTPTKVQGDLEHKQKRQSRSNSPSETSFVSLLLAWHSNANISVDWDAASDSSEKSDYNSLGSDSNAAGIEVDFPESPLSTASSSAMTSTWSSASTGKPQLSYAERLRIAKSEANQSAKTSDTLSAVMEKPVDARSKMQGDRDQSSVSTAATTSSSANLTPSETSTTGPSRSTSHDATASDSQNTPASEGSPASTPAIKPPVVNIWAERKKQLEEKARRADNVASADAKSERPSAENSSHANDSSLRPIASQQSAHDASVKQSEPDVRHSEQGTSVSAGQQNVRDSMGPNDAATNEHQEVNGKPAKGQRKKKQNAPNEEKSAKTSYSPPPSLSDAANWPSPALAISERNNRSLDTNEQGVSGRRIGSEERNTETGSQQISERRESVSSSRVDKLNDLNVELLRQPGGNDKQRKGGKQWIPIVPTITHPTPSGRQQSQKRNTSASHSVISSASTSTSASRSQKQRQTSDNRRSSSNPESRNPRSRLQHHLSESTESTSEQQQSEQPKGEDSRQMETKQADEKIENIPDRQAASPYNLPTSTQSTPGTMSPRLGIAHSQVGQTSAVPHSIRNGSRTPRGARGRGGSRRAEEARQARSGSPDDSHSAVTSDTLAASTANTVFSPLNAPRGPRASSFSRPQRPLDVQNGFGMPFAQPYMSMPFGGPAGFAPQTMFHGGYVPHQMMLPYGVPFLESTPSELAPKGSSSTTEPTQALLFQVEFYFSHQNLQGDFYLRKNMDHEGFVSIEIVSSFNRVKRLAGENNAKLIKETLHFSKALQFNEDKTKIRKAYGWEPYVLVEGQRPQQAQVLHSSPPYYPLQAASAYRPFVPHRQRGSSNAHAPSQTSPKRHSPSKSERSLESTTKVSPGGQREEMEQKSLGSSAEEDDDDSDDDEPSLGVVAATGLGGALRTSDADT